MTDDTSAFDASGPALGYLYQCRLGLLLALRKNDDPGLTITIEKVDDISFEQAGTPLERLQTKHQINPGIVSDSSEAIWKTLRIWSEDVLARRLVPEKTLLCLVASGTAPPNSALAYLRGDGERKPEEALPILEAVAKKTKNKALEPAVNAFTRLSAPQKLDLIKAVHVLDNSPTAVNLRPLLLHELRLSAEPQHRNALADRLEGWWFDQVIAQLTTKGLAPIPVQRVLAEAVDISRAFHRDSLPDDFLTAMVPAADCPDNDVRRFVRQIELIGVTAARIRAAQEDFYRAVAQRSRWIKDSLIDIQELTAFESRLHAAWKAMYLIALEMIGDSKVDDELRKAGIRLYNWAQTEAPTNCNLWVRPQFQAGYMTTGSFHVLADGEPPRVGWHPRYLDLLGNRGPKRGDDK